jgi:hypothetical protein
VGDNDAAGIVGVLDNDMHDIEWFRDTETGALSEAGATIEYRAGDSFHVWQGPGAVAIGRDFYGQTVNVPNEMIPALILVLSEMYRSTKPEAPDDRP